MKNIFTFVKSHHAIHFLWNFCQLEVIFYFLETNYYYFMIATLFFAIYLYIHHNYYINTDLIQVIFGYGVIYSSVFGFFIGVNWYLWGNVLIDAGLIYDKMTY